MTVKSPLYGCPGRNCGIVFPTDGKTPVQRCTSACVRATRLLPGQSQTKLEQGVLYLEGLSGALLWILSSTT